jgi:biotin carboxyl carrier protein
MQVPLVEPGAEPAVAPEPALEEKGWWRNRRWQVLIAVLLCCALAASLWLTRRSKPPGIHTSSTAIYPRGTLRLKGTTQAVRSRAIQAPIIAGDKEETLTITNLRTAGSAVKQGDILVEFDRQAQLRDSLDKQAQTDKLTDDLLQEQAKEDAARAKDETEIKVAEGDLAKAELEMQKVELLSRIDAEKARETLDESKATLDQLRETYSLKRKTAQAAIRVIEIQRDRARETMLHAQANAALMQVHSPINGIVVLNTIWKQGNLGEVQEGDQVRSGVPFLQVVDPSEMEVQVPVNQQDLLALHDGQKGKVHLDAYPDLVCPAQLEVIDPMGRAGGFSQRVRTFSAVWSIHCTDSRLLPGLSAAVDAAPDPSGNPSSGNSR